MSADHVTLGMHDVDSRPDADISLFAAKLSAMRELESFASYKRDVVKRLALGPGDAVLDVGCGLGHDVADLAAVVGRDGRAVGVDTSEAFLHHAASSELPHLKFVLADGERLPFESNSFDAAKIDRTLQHAAHPEAIVDELHRVVRPGGRVVCVEPDWETLTITVDDHATTRVIANHWSDHYRNGWIGRRLEALVHAAGSGAIEVTGHVLRATGHADVETAFFWDVAGMIDNVKRQSPVPDEIDAWLDKYHRADAEGTLAGTLTLFMVSGINGEEHLS